MIMGVYAWQKGTEESSQEFFNILQTGYTK